MKTVFTFRKWSSMLVLLTMMASVPTWAQKSPASPITAKCAGFTATITNGSVLNLCAGASIALNSTPSNASYTYQWQVQTTTGGPFTSIGGATGVGYTASSLGSYRVIISTGSCKDTSGITSLVRIAPTGGNLTAANSTVCQGAPGGLITGNSVPGADQGIITFTWETSSNGTTWTAIPGATDLSYLAGVISSTTYYRRVAADNCGNKAYSNVITLSVASALNAGTLTPMTQTITRAQQAATINSASPASGGTGNYSYQWQVSLFERGAWTDIPGATGLSYTPPHLDETHYYRRVVKDMQCGNIAVTDGAVVFVSDGILNAGAFITASSCVFPGGTPAQLQTFYPPRGGTPPYQTQWQSSTDNVNFTDIPGATGANYQPGPLTQSTWFRKKITDAAGTTVYSGSEKITLISTPLTGGTIKATSLVACLGSNPAEIKSTASPTGYGEKLSYQWQYWTASSNTWTDIPGQIREGLIPDPITEKTRFRRLAIDGCGQNTRTATSNEVEIDIRPAIVAGDISPTSQVIRPGDTPLPITNVTAPSGGTGAFTISWEAAPIAYGPFSTVASQTGLSYQPPALSRSMYYRRAVMDQNCLATKYTYTVEVYLNTSAPVVGGNLSGSGCVFPGNAPGLISSGSIPVSGGTPPYTYSWETRSGSTTTWTAIAGATSASYQPGPITQTTQYRRKATDAYGDFAYSDIFTITLTTTPLNGGTIAGPTTATCPGGTPGMITSIAGYSGNGENPTYQWQMQTVGGTWSNIAGANGETYQPGPLSQKTYFRRAVTDMCSGVTRTAYSNTVVIDVAAGIPLKAGIIDAPIITCTGTAPGLIRSVLDACGTSTVSYQWEIMTSSTWSPVAGATSASYSPASIGGNVKFRRKVKGACGDSAYSNTVDIFVYPGIVAGIIGGDQNICPNQTPAMIGLQTNCHYTDGTVSYQWQSASNATGPWTNISGATSGSYQPAASSSNMYYRLMVKSTTCNMTATTNMVTIGVTACRQTSTARNSAGIQPSEVSGGMRVYPNPLTGNTVDVQVQTKGKVNVRMMNVEGRNVPVTVSQTGTGLIKVNFGKAPARGMYILNVNDDNGTRTEKVLVQ